MEKEKADKVQEMQVLQKSFQSMISIDKKGSS